MNKLAAMVTLIIAVTAGCRGDIRPVTYYTLSSVQDTASGILQLSGDEFSIGVGPIGFPDYLNRPYIASRDDSTKIVYSETHRWAGLLERDLAGVVAQDLSVILKTNRVRTYPWSGSFQPRYQVWLDVIRFDGRLREQARLNVIWRVLDHSQSGQPVVVRRSVITEPVGDESSDDYDALVSAQSRALERMSREIADVIGKGPAQ